MTRFFGGLLLAVGILMMTCSGLCSLAIIASGFSMAMREPSVLIIPLIVGGIPFTIGFGAFRWGKYLLREPGDPDG
jgi:hypothetical protein